MPSTTSSSVSSDFASSTVITPSLPTFCMALAIVAPISWSPLAEMVPTCAISSLEVTFLALAFSSSRTAVTAMSTPRFRSIGFAPAATDFAPSLTMACASRVAVVVPSPAVSEVFDATSRHHLRAHILELVLELDLLRHRHAVLRDARGAERFLEHDVAALGAERHLDRIGQDVDAAEHALAGVLRKFYFLSCHG